MIKLDANESPFNGPDNLYPDEELIPLKKAWGFYEHIPYPYTYFCNGTEEAVDLCIRVFSEPYNDEVLTITPTRGIYQKRTQINRVRFSQCELSPVDYSLDIEALWNQVNEATKLIFICSPNSPTGNRFDRKSLEILLQRFKGILVIDESYIDFCLPQSNLSLLNTYKNLIIIRSFSHAWSSAGARLSVMIARPDIINRIKLSGLTHPLNSFVISYAEDMFQKRLEVHKWVRQIIEERTKVILALESLPLDLKVFPSDANFVFVTGSSIENLYSYLLNHGILVKLVSGGLRISVGLPSDNSALLAALRKIH